MNNWQLPLVAMIVLAAAAYLARRTWRAWAGGKAGGCGGCRCAAPPAPTAGQGTLIPAEQITLRLRKGANPPAGPGADAPGP
ncbi:MAG TPA: hypothetical protein VKA46_16645 [Gemmataceae bacterium]|nr:hypothetical protein [Gemmataceae bacterium]